MVGIVAPVATAFGLVMLGARATFALTTAIVALSALPLCFTPNVAIARRAPGAFKASMPGVKMFFADGWIAAGYYFVWQLALFFTLGQNFVEFGGALAIAAVAGAIGGLFLGRHIDAGHGGRAALIAAAALALVILLRFLALGHPLLAVAANALGSLASCLYIPTMMTAVYNQAKRSPCILRFHVAAEGGWDVGGSSALLVTVLLLRLGVPLAYGVLVGLIGTAAAYWQLRAYFAQIRNQTLVSP
jgi:hypothetical protein